MSAGWKFKAKNPIDNVSPSFLGFLWSSSTWLDNPERDIVAFHVDFVIHSLDLSFLLTLIRILPVNKLIFYWRETTDSWNEWILNFNIAKLYFMYIYLLYVSTINSGMIRIRNDLDTNSRVIDHLDKACRILHLLPFLMFHLRSP